MAVRLQDIGISSAETHFLLRHALYCSLLHGLISSCACTSLLQPAGNTDSQYDERTLISQNSVILQFRKMDNHPGLKNLLMDEAKKQREVADAKNQGTALMLLEEMLTGKEKESGQSAIDAKELRAMLEKARKKIGKK